jgi:4-hydroxy-tetrahydrodipicolinate synthase
MVEFTEIFFKMLRMIRMAIFTGAGVAMITPFHADGTVNYEKLEKLVDYHCENGTDSIIVCGTTGEASTLSEEEHMECIRVVAARAKGRIPVIAGTGSNCTQTAIDLLVVTPYYNNATQKGLVGHYTAIAQATDCPIIMYNVQSRTGCNIQPATAAELVKNVDTIVGIKEASGNISQIAKVMQLTNGDIDLYSGNDDQIVPILSLGGIGVISVLSNIAPKETHDICAKFFAGDVKGSCELQLKALPLIEQLFCEVNPIPVKKAAELMGFEPGSLRLPLTEMEPEHAKNLAQAMKDFGIKLA